MAEDARRPRLAQRPRNVRAWDAERIAESLVARRDRLVEQLPRELAAARSLSRDQRELVVDEAIDYMVTEYAKPISDEQILERAFWATASFRVKRVHEGRGATVRAGWHRVDVDAVDLASSENDPVEHAVRSVERGALLEFVATLSEQERAVFAVKYADATVEQGRVVVARRLGLPVADVRRTERAITRKLNRFVAIVSAGSLCTHRGPAIEALATGMADEQQALLARVHLDHCAACRVAFTEHLRALQTGELQHRIAQLLPMPAAAAERRPRAGAWEAVTDWATRPFTSEAATTGSHLAAGGRGIGTIATAKLAALCIGVTAVGGGTYCVTAVLKQEPRPDHRPRVEAPRQSTPPPTPERLPSAGPAMTAVRQAEERRAAQRRAARRRATEDQRQARATAFATGSPATRHEREAPISPPAEAPGAQISEFDPAPSEPVTQQPAAAPSTGAPEFP
jgi:hypothetical protein